MTKARKPKDTGEKSSRSKAKAPKNGGARPKKRAKGHPMIRNLFLLALLAGAGYAAWKVPYHGQTLVDRGLYYVEHDTDFRLPHSAPARPTTPEVPKKGHDAVADRRGPGHTPIAEHPPAEHITQEDRDALDRLIPR
jgi:hypothetical protein